MPRIKTPVGRLRWPTIIALNAAFWPTWTFACGYVAHRAPRKFFASDNAITSIRPEETAGFYRDQLHIQDWKDHLPEAGGWFAGGFSKDHIGATDISAIDDFIAETRRAELMHWAVVAGIVIPRLWNPVWAMPIHIVVAKASNLPCIAVQRYNRIRLLSLRGRVSDLGATRADPLRSPEQTSGQASE